MFCEVTYGTDKNLETAPPIRNEPKISLANVPVQEEAVSCQSSSSAPTAMATAVEKTFGIVSESFNSDSIWFDGAMHNTVRSTFGQQKQIEIYKIEHKITSKEMKLDDFVYVELGPKGTLVPFNEFKKIDWTEALQATYDLLSLVFPLHVLETHTISRNFMPMEFGDVCRSRPQLDDNKVYDIQYHITRRTGMSDEAFSLIAGNRMVQLAKAKGYNPFQM